MKSTHQLPPIQHLLIPLILLRSTKHRKRPLPTLRNRKNRRHVPTPIAVVWRAPDSDQLVVEHELEAFLHELVCTCDERELIDVVELDRQRCRIEGYLESQIPAINKSQRTSCVTFPPNNHPAPLGLTAQFSISSGSDHIRSKAKSISDREVSIMGM